MLTRIEIDGFKTFEKFGIDLSPFGTFNSVPAGVFQVLSLVPFWVSYLQILESSGTKNERRGAHSDYFLVQVIAKLQRQP